MSAPKPVACTHCGYAHTEDCGPQKGIDKKTGRWYTVPVRQCLNPATRPDGQPVCQTSFYDESERRFIDTGKLVPTKDAA